MENGYVLEGLGVACVIGVVACIIREVALETKRRAK
jgi:hypothetical protein